MKALSLWQPWAEAMRLKAKRCETRSWKTNYRGYLAIHASKYRMNEDQLACIGPDVWLRHNLTFGAVICIVKLVDCQPTLKIRQSVSEREKYWGNFTDGRFAWITSPADLIDLPIPIFTRGYQGLFNWQPPAELEKLIAEREK